MIQPRLWPWTEFISSGGQESQHLIVQHQPFTCLMRFPGWPHVICVVLTPCIFKCILSSFKELSTFSRSPTDQISVSFSDLSSSSQVQHIHCSFSSYFWTRFISPGSQTCHHLFSICIPNPDNLMVSVTTYKDNLFFILLKYSCL